MSPFDVYLATEIVLTIFSNTNYDNDEDVGPPMQNQLAIGWEVLSKASHHRNLKDMTQYTTSKMISN